MLEIEERLAQGHIIGILADRGIGKDKGQSKCSFLGALASFPTGPFRLAALLKRPVFLMFGIYRGARHYDIYFESLSSAGEQHPDMMRQYVDRLEHYCRAAPFNWFNFYEFWA